MLPVRLPINEVPIQTYHLRCALHPWPTIIPRPRREVRGLCICRLMHVGLCGRGCVCVSAAPIDFFLFVYTLMC